MWKKLGPLVLFVLFILIVCFLWFVLWKLILQPNPLIRDFFDLDKQLDNKKQE